MKTYNTFIYSVTAVLIKSFQLNVRYCQKDVKHLEMQAHIRIIICGGLSRRHYDGRYQCSLQT